MNYAKQLQTIDYAQKKMEIKRMSIIEKAVKSDNPDDVIAATKAMQKVSVVNKNLSPVKAFFIDPLDFNSNLGYKDKTFTLTYSTLKKMAGVPIINAIIKTRKNQIADFSEPQSDRYSTGFVVRKKARLGYGVEMSNKEKKIANKITDFILNCGRESSWTTDDFDTFIRKIVDDSLTYDQMTFECIRNRKGELERFLATDASTFRFADCAFREDYNNPYFTGRGGSLWYNSMPLDNYHEIDGYLPQYVQIYQGAVVNQFYPWELCFAVRNPSTSIYSNGYGTSELEELINVVTSMLWGDEYNRRFFSQGSAPKGLLRVKGNINETALQQFKQQWQAMISGVMNGWKTPVVEADVDWIDLQKNNRDMEYSSWMEYLIKLSCAIYSIDPSEIGWDISRSGSNSGLFEASQAERIQNSKDKGLYPMLKFIQRKINKYIVESIDPDFEFIFMGMNGITIEKELEMDIKKMSNFQTINETRQKWDLPELEVEAGNVISNSIFWQAYSQEKQQQNQQMQGGFGDFRGGNEGESEEDGGDYENPFDAFVDEDEDDGTGNEDNEENGNEDEGKNSFDEYADEEDEEKAENDNNIFVKAFENFLKEEEQN